MREHLTLMITPAADERQRLSQSMFPRLRHDFEAARESIDPRPRPNYALPGMTATGTSDARERVSEENRGDVEEYQRNEIRPQAERRPRGAPAHALPFCVDPLPLI